MGTKAVRVRYSVSMIIPLSLGFVASTARAPQLGEGEKERREKRFVLRAHEHEHMTLSQGVKPRQFDHTTALFLVQQPAVSFHFPSVSNYGIRCYGERAWPYQVSDLVRPQRDTRV